MSNESKSLVCFGSDLMNMFVPSEIICDINTQVMVAIRVRKLPEEICFFPEEWKKLEKRCFFQFLPEETGRNWKKYM